MSPTYLGWTGACALFLVARLGVRSYTLPQGHTSRLLTPVCRSQHL